MVTRAAARWRLLLGVFLLVASLSLQVRTARAQAAAEADLMAALVYNFALFTEWTAGQPGSTGNAFTICYAGADVAAAFAQLAGKSIRNRTVVSRQAPAEGPYDGCQVMYWHGVGLRRGLPGKGAPGVLTIGNGAEFLERGGMVEMHLEDARVVFSINVDPARNAGLSFNSRLLRLGKRVTGASQ